MNKKSLLNIIDKKSSFFCKTDNMKIKILFSLFLLFYITLGVQLSYNYDFTKIYNFLFDADTARVISDMSDIFGNHYRLSVHPLFVLFTEPIYFIVSGITQDKMLALVFISSVVSALSVVMVYKIISLFSRDETINLLLSVCYGLTFSNIIFTIGIELYNIATLFLLLLWYFIAKKLNQAWSKTDYLMFITLGVLTLSITITNSVIFLIACFILLISKTMNLKKLVLINISVGICFMVLDIFQKLIWHNTPLLFGSVGEEKLYMNFNFTFSAIKNVISSCFFNSIISSKIFLSTDNLTNPMLKHETPQWWTLALLCAFFILIGYFLFKNKKKNLYFNIGLILSLAFNFTLHLIYGNSSPFLYSLHFVYLIFLLFGVNYSFKNNRKFRKFILFLISLIILFECIFNGISFVRILHITSNYLKPNFYAKTFPLPVLIIMTLIVIISLSVICYFIYILVKKLKSGKFTFEKIKYIIPLFALILAFESVFVTVQTSAEYGKFLIFNIKKPADSLVISKNYTDFKNQYPEDVDAYLDYLTDLDTKTEIKNFDCKSYLIIPNRNTILIQKNDGSFSKVFNSIEYLLHKRKR